MNKNINDLTNKQLTWIIQNYLSNKDYYLLKYLFDLLTSENIKSKDIKKKLEESFEHAKESENDFAYKYIDCLSNKINNDKINELKNYKDYYSIIYQLLVTCDKNNIFDVEKKQELIKITMDELKLRKEFFDMFFTPYKGVSNLEELIQDDLTLFIYNNKTKFNDNNIIEKYKTYLQEIGRINYASYILNFNSSDIISNDFYNILTFYPFKPYVEGDLQTYFLSLIMDWFIPNKAIDSLPTYDVILNIDDEVSRHNDELLKYTIEEKTVEHVRKTYNRLCRYRENNELLSTIGLEEFYQNKNNSFKLELFENQMKTSLKNNDMLRLGQFRCEQISTEMKKKIQDIWDTIINDKIYPLFSYWLNDFDELFKEIYNKNKLEFKKIIKDYVNFDIDTEEDVYKKLEQTPAKTTYKVLCENEQKLYKSIDKYKMHELPLNNQREKEVACYYLSYLLSGITNTNTNDILQKVIHQFRDVETIRIKNIIETMNDKSEQVYNNYHKKFNNIPIDTDTQINNFSYTKLLDDNSLLLLELKVYIQKIKLFKLGRTDGLFDDTKMNLRVQYDIFMNLDIDDYFNIELEELDDILNIVEKEQEKYNFYTIIKNYFQILGATNQYYIKVRNQLIEYFYNEYSIIMNSLDKDDEEFINYLTNEALKFIYKEIKNKNDMNNPDILEKFINYILKVYKLYFNKDNSNKTLYKRKNS